MNFMTFLQTVTLIVSETHFTSGNNCKVIKCKLYSDDRACNSHNASGGTAIYVSNTIPP